MHTPTNRNHQKSPNSRPPSPTFGSQLPRKTATSATPLPKALAKPKPYKERSDIKIEKYLNLEQGDGKGRIGARKNAETYEKVITRIRSTLRGMEVKLEEIFGDEVEAEKKGKVERKLSGSKGRCTSNSPGVSGIRDKVVSGRSTLGSQEGERPERRGSPQLARWKM